MPVIWELRDQILVVAVIGGYATHELTGAIEEATRDPRFSDAMPLLIDSRSSLSVVSAHQVRDRMVALGAMGKRGLFPRCALVSRSEPYRLQLVTQAAQELENLGIEARIFTDLDAGLAWLRGAG
jgi:hypothetical protein